MRRVVLLQDSYLQDIISLNVNAGRPEQEQAMLNELVATVPPKDVIILLPYIGLHSKSYS